MSLIFKALQRSRRQASHTPEDESKPADRKNSVTWRNVLLSPSSALLVGGIVILSGIGAIQLVTFISSKTPALTPQVAAATASPPSDSITYEVMNTPDKVDTETVGAGFAGAGPMPATNSDEGQFQFFPAVSPTGGEAPETHAARETRQQGKDNNLAVYRPTPAPPGGGVFSGGGALPFPARTQSQESEPEKHAATFGTRTIPTIAVTHATKHVLDPEHQRQAEQARNHLTVTRLASQLLSAIRAGDLARVNELLEQLTTIKGADNPFVQKLAAYSHIQQGNLEQARNLLAKILAKQPDDLDAGLNMAVVDIRSAHYDQARQRLERLLNLYPEEGQISDYLRQLGH